MKLTQISILATLALGSALAHASVNISNTTPSTIKKVVMCSTVYCPDGNYSTAFSCEHYLNYGESIVFSDNYDAGCYFTYNCDSTTTIPIPQWGVEAIDAQNSTRKAATTGTLKMVRANSSQSRTATINLVSSATPPSGFPQWSGHTSGSHGSTSVTYTGTSGDTVSAYVPHWGGTKSVAVQVVQKTTQEYSIIPNFISSFHALLQKFETQTAFGPNNRFTFSSSLVPSGSRELVDKPNSPDTTYDYSGAATFDATVTGRISHPTLSGSIPPSWLPGDPWALWEVYASAAFGIEGEVALNYLNSVSPSQLNFDGSGQLGATFQAGVYALAQVLGYFAEGSAYVEVPFSWKVESSGAVPNKVVESFWQIGAATVNTNLLLKRNSDNYVIATKSFSQSIYGSWTQNPKTTLIGQPSNPGP